MIPGWGALAGYVAGWVDKLIPSKKAALVDELNALNAQYNKVLERGDDTFAATLRKRMVELRKRLNFTEGDL
jgi:hypothetical protein